MAETSPTLSSLLTRMLAKLRLRAPLDEQDCNALLSLPYQLKTVEAGKYLVREGSRAQHSSLIVSGFAIRQKLTIDGGRQIVSVHVPGDFVDLDGALLTIADHNVQVLTLCELALVPVQAIRDLIHNHPMVAHALWIDTLVDGAIFREWITNVGRRDARARIAHLLCEFARRLELTGLGNSAGYELPMTQEQLADATGLTAVHVNRTLKGLEAEGLVVRNKRYVHIPDWDRLRNVAGFSETYLHFDQVNPDLDRAQIGMPGV
jgi:CRP-like cAMP-binding protein